MPHVYSYDLIDTANVEEITAGFPDLHLPNFAEAAAIAMFSNFYSANNIANDSEIWSDNGYKCNSNECHKFEDDNGHVVLLGKNGDAPKNFKILEHVEPECSASALNACTSSSECTAAGGIWHPARPNGFCSGN